MPDFKHIDALDLLYKRATSAVETTDDVADDAKKNSFGYEVCPPRDYPALRVKRFDAGSYNGPSLQDFILRLENLDKTARWMLEKQKNESKLTDAEYQRNLGKLETSKQESLQLLKKECSIEPKTLNALKANESNVIETIGKATLHIQSFTFQALMLINPEAFESKAALIKGLKEYEIAESHFTALQDRPDFINIYEAPSSQSQCVSMQRTVGKTIPSTERYDRPGFEGMLPNFVECGVGHLDKVGALKLDFKGYRHSSYPPIRIPDDFERQKRSAQIAKSMLSELAKQESLKGNSKEPIVLNLSSLSLLTPYAFPDKFVPKDEKEFRQLKESYDAMMMYNGRVTKIKVEDREVSVRLNLTMLNAPGNPMGVAIARRKSFFRKLSYSALEKDINAQGMSQFIGRATDFLMRQDPKWKDNKTLKQMMLIRNVSAIRIEDTRQKIQESLESDNKKEYFKLKKEEARLNKQISDIERKNMRKIRGVLKSHRRELAGVLNALKKSPKSDADAVAELFFQTLLMSVDGRVEPIQWGARFLLASQKMGHHVDFYCKSGEDRTGRMQNMVEELCIFYRNNGHYPSYDVQNKKMNPEEQKIQANIALSVNEFSVSRDICGQNCIGARGLQIAESLSVNQMLPAKSGDAIGKMAKGIFSLRGSGMMEEIKKKIPFLQIDTKRQNLLRKTVESNPANTWVNESLDCLGFQSRFVGSEETSKERRRVTLTREPPVARRMGEIDTVVIEKQYPEEIVGRLEKNLNGVKDVTIVPHGGLSQKVDEELAIEQAFATIAPPFDAQSSVVVLSGNDSKQVARLYAVLLVLRDQIPSLKSLQIQVEGEALSKEGRFANKKSEKLFVEHYLSRHARQNIAEKQKEFSRLYDVKSKLREILGGNQSKVLDALEGMKNKLF